MVQFIGLNLNYVNFILIQCMYSIIIILLMELNFVIISQFYNNGTVLSIVPYIRMIRTVITHSFCVQILMICKY